MSAHCSGVSWTSSTSWSRSSSIQGPRERPSETKCADPDVIEHEAIGARRALCGTHDRDGDEDDDGDGGSHKWTEARAGLRREGVITQKSAQHWNYTLEETWSSLLRA